MSDRIFYVGAQDADNALTGYVPAKFLVRDGRYLMDPTPGGSQRAPLFSDGMGSNRTDGGVTSPDNYLIVPANYSEQQAPDRRRQGLAGWMSSLSGVDPQEPAPPAWPPQVDGPIRYLSRRTYN